LEQKPKAQGFLGLMTKLQQLKQLF